MLKYVLITLALLAVLTVSFLGIRGAISRQPPRVIFGDMETQPKYKNQSDTTFFPDGREMRLPPAGAIAWGHLAGQPDAAMLNDDAAAFQLKQSPRKLDRALLDRGQQVFTTYCIVCHGAFGSGNGITTQYGQSPPANYHTDRIRQSTDGYLYQVITEGKGLMGPYGPSIRPQDRWAVVAYIRALQRAGNATIKDVPENMRQELEQAPQ